MGISIDYLICNTWKYLLPLKDDSSIKLITHRDNFIENKRSNAYLP